MTSSKKLAKILALYALSLATILSFMIVFCTGIGYAQEDVTPPAAITDLSVSGVTSSSATLTWTAPGDDGTTGTASSYDVRYLQYTPVTESNWDSASQATGVPAPQVAGSSETFTVTGLNSSTEYYFAVKTADEVPNWSGISNSASRTTSSTGGGGGGGGIAAVPTMTLWGGIAMTVVLGMLVVYMVRRRQTKPTR